MAHRKAGLLRCTSPPPGCSHFQPILRLHGDDALRNDDVHGPTALVLAQLDIGVGDVGTVDPEPQVKAAVGSHTLATHLRCSHDQLRPGFAYGDLVVPRVMPFAASTMFIVTTSGGVPGHWVTDEDACRYCEAFPTPPDVTTMLRVEKKVSCSSCISPLCLERTVSGPSPEPRIVHSGKIPGEFNLSFPGETSQYRFLCRPIGKPSTCAGEITSQMPPCVLGPCHTECSTRLTLIRNRETSRFPTETGAIDWNVCAGLRETGGGSPTGQGRRGGLSTRRARGPSRVT